MGHKVKWCLRLLSRKNTRPDEVETVRITSVRRAELTIFQSCVMRYHLILEARLVVRPESISLLYLS